MVTDHGIDMLSAAMYERFLEPVVERHNQIRGTKPSTQFHHCGRGPHLFPTVRKHFAITGIDALTFPLVDIEKVRRDLGEDVWIMAILDNTLVNMGTEETIWQAVRDLMRAKGKGRFALQVGDMLKGTSMKNLEIVYEAVKAYGKY